MALLLRRLSTNTLALLAFLLAAAFLVTVAYLAALVIETRTEKVVMGKFSDENIDWVTVHADGLQLNLSGTAPNEAARFRAVNLVGSLIDSTRIRDGLEVPPASAVEAPDFSVQMLRTEEGIQLIGLMPAYPGEGALTKMALVDAAAQIVPEAELQNFLETANYPAPETWSPALDFGLAALGRLERSKISVGAELVEVTALSDSAEEKEALERDLRGLAPAGVRVVLDISAPRPVMSRG